MSRRPFDPEELDQPTTTADQAISELERYAMASDTDAPRGLSERVMAAVEHEPAPRRGFLAWLTIASPTGGAGRLVRVGAFAATLVLAVAGALFAGQLADLLRDVGGDASPTPTVSPSPSSAPSATPSPSLSVAPTPSATPEASDGHGGSGEIETAKPTPTQIPGDDGDKTETPRPSATATASPSPTPTATP